MKFYPIYIKLDPDIRQIQFYDSSLLRPISNKEILRFFGIEVSERDKLGLVKRSNQIEDKDIVNFLSLILTNRDLVLSSNFVFETEIRDGVENARIFNEAVRLSKRARVGLTLGFDDTANAVGFLHPNPFYHKYPLEHLFSNEECSTLKVFYEKIKCSNNPKLNIMITKFFYALSGEHISQENRFTDLVSVLEMLLLPSGRGELQYRLSLRIANILGESNPGQAKLIYRDFMDSKNGLYTIRSEILHCGKSKSLNENRLLELENYTRSLLQLYLDNPNKFTETELTNICLKS